MNQRLEPTPLQKIVGFEVAEETYDQLPFHAQIVLDLLISGHTQQDIADCLGLGQSTVNDIIRRSRVQLAQSKLRLVLESRVYYKETHRLVLNGD